MKQLTIHFYNCQSCAFGLEYIKTMEEIEQDAESGVHTNFVLCSRLKGMKIKCEEFKKESIYFPIPDACPLEDVEEEV
jgi:hypothetical protein